MSHESLHVVFHAILIGLESFNQTPTVSVSSKSAEFGTLSSQIDSNFDADQFCISSNLYRTPISRFPPKSVSWSMRSNEWSFHVLHAFPWDMLFSLFALRDYQSMWFDYPMMIHYATSMVNVVNTKAETSVPFQFSADNALRMILLPISFSVQFIRQKQPIRELKTLLLMLKFVRCLEQWETHSTAFMRKSQLCKIILFYDLGKLKKSRWSSAI